MRHVQIYVNGILTWPGWSEAWNDRAATETNVRTDATGDAYVYLSGATITRLWGQRKRAQLLAGKIKRYARNGWTVDLIGHSNGCDVILDALPVAAWPRQIRSLHLISAAAEASFQANGLNWALRTAKVHRVHVYVAGQDWPLRLADTFTARTLFGYGALGRRGPQDVDPAVRPQVSVIRREAYGHSDWWSPEHWRDTFSLLHG